MLSLEASEAFQNFRASVAPAIGTGTRVPLPILHVPRNPGWMPQQVLAIDGSTVSTTLRQDFPGADVSLLKISLISIDLDRLNRLTREDIPSPALFRDMEEAHTIDAVMPGANIIRPHHLGDTPQNHFRAQVEDILGSRIQEGWETLGETIAAIEGGRHDLSKIRCPVPDCGRPFQRGTGSYTCSCPSAAQLYESDSLLFWEKFNENGVNGEVHGEVRHFLEVAMLMNIVRYFASQSDLFALRNTVFILDGPLAMFGDGAWLTPYLRDEIERINKICTASGFELALFGYEKSGQFVNHFERIDFHEQEGPRKALPVGTVIAPDAEYINQCVTFRTRGSRSHGEITYFGRKVFYKTMSGDHAVITTAMGSPQARDFKKNDLSCYPRLSDCLTALDHLSTYLYRDGFMPLIRAHSRAAIPIQRGSDILRQMFRNSNAATPSVSDGPAAIVAAAASR